MRRPPAWLQDMVPSSTNRLPQHLPRLPEPLPPLDFEEVASRVSPPPASPSHSVVNDVPPPSLPPEPYETQPNIFGVFRRYAFRPKHDPDEGITPDLVSAAPTHVRDNPAAENHALQPWGAPVISWFNKGREAIGSVIAPFLNYSTFLVMWWQHTGSREKSAGETQRLVDRVILHERFNKEELRGFSARRECRRLDEFNASGGSQFTPETGWREETVTLKLPKAGEKYASEEDVPTTQVRGIWVRDLLDTLIAACREPGARNLHWWPSKLFHKDPTDENPDTPPQRLYTDFYNSTAFLREHEAIQKNRNPEDPPDLEYAVVPLLAQSDSTRLAQFGRASLWPIYIWILSKCKHIRTLPHSFLAMHLAYVPHVRSARTF